MVTVKQYELSDGSLWTAKELGEHLNLTSTAARYRLNQSSDAEIVLRGRHINSVRRKKKYKQRTFKLSNGEVLNAEDIGNRFGVNISTMYGRLLRGIRDIEELAKKPTQLSVCIDRERHPKTVKEFAMKRNAYDPMSRLFLKMRVS